MEVKIPIYPNECEAAGTSKDDILPILSRLSVVLGELEDKDLSLVLSPSNYLFVVHDQTGLVLSTIHFNVGEKRQMYIHKYSREGCEYSLMSSNTYYEGKRGIPLDFDGVY